MASQLETDFQSPTNFDSDAEEATVKSGVEKEETSQPNNNVEDILKRLQSSGALKAQPKKEFYCFTCEEDFRDWEELENHLVQHISLPSVIVNKLPSDEEDTAHSGDENWSDDEEEAPPSQTTPKKIDVSELLNKSGLSIKKSSADNITKDANNSALDKLSGLGLSIKKGTTPIKQEKPETEPKNNDEVMQRIGQLGGIKLKLKSDGGNTNSFSVVNGLKDFKTSDDEDAGSGDDVEKEGSDEDQDKSSEQDTTKDKAADEGDEKNSESKDSDSDDEEVPLIQRKTSLKAQAMSKASAAAQNANNASNSQVDSAPLFPKPPTRAIKITPKRGANLPTRPSETTQALQIATSTPERRESQSSEPENIVVKKEVEDATDTAQSYSNTPLFSGQIKSERMSPPPAEAHRVSNPIIAQVKSEPGINSTVPNAPQPNTISHASSAPTQMPTTPLLSVSKMEETGVTVIEINGDSNDEDDDCCVVSATPAPDVKPIVPKTEPPPYSYPSSQSSFTSSAPILSSRMPTLSTEKQHCFNWNAPDSKPPLDMFGGKSADDIFESLISSATKKENLGDAEYISLDTLGPNHTCDVCNTRFTNSSLLEEHIRTTGHSKSIITPSSSLLPYGASSTGSILSSLLPVQQLAEQVGKLSSIGGSGAAYTHQQNVMINIQAYPGAGGMMTPQPQAYNSYPGSQSMPGYGQTPNNMYPGQTMPGHTMPGQYPGQNYMGQSYGQQSSYPGTIPQTSMPYSTTSTMQPSPMQSMQQAYGQSPMGQMGPPNHPYIPPSSPSSMRPPTSSASGAIKIQNIQSFPPGQLMGAPGQQLGQQVAPGTSINPQMPTPTQIKMAPGANMAGVRPRMANVRGARPTIRPGIQVQGQVRGAKPGVRMPMKRPAGAGGAMPGMKRKSDGSGMPTIQSVHGANKLGSQISITKKAAPPVNKEANAMADVLASRGISIKQKQKSRSPSPERPIPHIPNLGAGVSIKHTSKSSNFTIPEARVGGGGLAICKICKKTFGTQNSLTVHMANAHPQTKLPTYKCDECPASYRNSLQLQHHKRVFHNATGPNRELGLPVVDLSQEENVQRLSSLGIFSYIPLANREQPNGTFGIPILSAHNSGSSMHALGADGILSLGPLKTLPNT